MSLQTSAAIRLGDLDPKAFRTVCTACAALWHLCIVDQWVRLTLRNGRTDQFRANYLTHGPRTWSLLEQAVHAPVAAPLADALDRWIAPDRRRNPPDRAA